VWGNYDNGLFALLLFLQIIFTCVDGAWHLCDVGFGGLGIAEPIFLQAYDEAAAAAANTIAANGEQQQQQQQAEPWAVLPGAAAAAAAGCPGESHQCGSRFRLRRGVINSAQHLPADQAASHPEALSHVGWYLQCFAGGQWVDVYYFTRTLVTQPVISACAEASFRTHPLFNNHMVVTKPLEDGRATLMDWVLKVRRNGEVVERRELASEEERDAVLADVFGINLEAGQH
jgi:arylamine N-acetyltransferase